MSSQVLHRMLGAVLVSWLALAPMASTGCGAGATPNLRVLGVEQGRSHPVVFVQVTNPASHSMRLQRLEYSFAASGEIVQRGSLPLGREVDSGAAIVVEVPFDVVTDGAGPVTLEGKLIAYLGKMTRKYEISATLNPSDTAPVTATPVAPDDPHE